MRAGGAVVRWRTGSLVALVCAMVVLGGMAVADRASAASTANTALINGDSVTTADGIKDSSTHPISLEQFAAQKAGYTVTVVNGATWDAMTQAQFAQYQVLIVGDPNCGDTPTSANSDASTWAPVVMGTSSSSSSTGNRVVVGTDPEDHYAFGGGGASPTNTSDPTTAGAEHLVQDGITYAGGVSGATGVYYDTSCSDPGTDISVLDQLTTTGAGHWTENSGPPCGGNVQQIASNPAFNSGPTKLTDANIQGWGCSDHITFPAFPTDWNALAVATDTSTKPTCGTDPDTSMTACGQAYVLVAGAGIVASSPDLKLTPSAGSDPVGGTHTVTASVTQSDGTTPAVGATVSFAVNGQNNGASGTCTTTTGASDAACTTDSTGAVRFTYHDGKGAGTDTINASVVIDEKTQHATATETWTTPAPAPAPKPTPPAPAPQTRVLASSVVSGSAHISRVNACIASNSYLAQVRGSQIAFVTYYLDGHLLSVVRHHYQGGFPARIRLPLRRLRHVTAVATFLSAAETSPKTYHLTLARCAVHRPAPPRFTG